MKQSPLARRWREALEQSTGLIISGAGALNDDYAAHGIAAWSLLVAWAKELGLPVLMVGQGVGPIYIAGNRERAKALLNCADYLNVREPISADTVRGLGVKVKPTITPDWAIANRPSIGQRERANGYLRNLGIADDDRFLAVSMHRRHSTSRRQIRHLAALFGDVARRAHASDRKILFVPNMRGSGYSDDRITFDMLGAQCKTYDLRRSVQLCRDPMAAGVCAAILGRAEGLVATRYHPLVFAMAEGVPAVGLSLDAYYDQKLHGASAIFKVQGNVKPWDDAQASSVLTALVEGHAEIPIPPGVEDVVAPFNAAIHRLCGQAKAR